jgi:DNA-binding transcriptional MerR regulator
MKNGISISEMARLHGLTRQTLIYYDKIGLFKPKYVDENGYRYYSLDQIPALREICFLKSIGVELKEIQEHFNGREVEKELQLLRGQKHELEKKIGYLNKLRESVNMRILAYRMASDAFRMQLFTPFIKEIPERQIVFKEYIKPINKDNLHRTLMELWKKSTLSDMFAATFGTRILKESAIKGSPIEGAGSCLFLPPWEKSVKDSILIPGGQYACVYAYHMPYDMTHAKRLMEWIEDNGMELTGDIIDVCLLDTTFYNEKVDVDFCVLEAPVRKKSQTT